MGASPAAAPAQVGWGSPMAAMRRALRALIWPLDMIRPIPIQSWCSDDGPEVPQRVVQAITHPSSKALPDPFSPGGTPCPKPLSETPANKP